MALLPKPLHLLPHFLLTLPLLRCRVRTSVFLVSVLCFSISALSAGSGRNGEVERLKLKVAQLESLLEHNTNILNSKISHLEKNGLVIEEMELKIQALQESLHNIEKPPDHSSYSEEKVKEMEDKVQVLWAESRKNNFEIHILESKVHATDEKVEALASQVQEVEGVVVEQWIQIRQTEQALQQTKTRFSKIKRIRESGCSLLKSARDFLARHLPKAKNKICSCFSKGNRSTLKSYLCRVQMNFKRFMLLIQENHHQLQYTIKQALESNECTAHFANKEIIFVLASAVIVYPMLFLLRLIKK